MSHFYGPVLTSWGPSKQTSIFLFHAIIARLETETYFLGGAAGWLAGLNVTAASAWIGPWRPRWPLRLRRSLSDIGGCRENLSLVSSEPQCNAYFGSFILTCSLSGNCMQLSLGIICFILHGMGSETIFPIKKDILKIAYQTITSTNNEPIHGIRSFVSNIFYRLSSVLHSQSLQLVHRPPTVMLPRLEFGNFFPFSPISAVEGSNHGKKISLVKRPEIITASLVHFHQFWGEWDSMTS